jgi:acetyl esterase/lipase
MVHNIMCIPQLLRCQIEVCVFTLFAILIFTPLCSEAGYLSERRAARLAARHEQPSDNDETGATHGMFKGKISVPGVKIVRDIPYGAAARQKIDVYIPPNAHNAPIVVMVHGGGWRMGDKSMTGVITHKGDHYVGRGFAFISVNNRLVPEADAYGQADDVAAAIAFIQNHAHDWGANPDQLVLMGHSAGAHLVALVASDPSRVIRMGGKRWAGTIPLDSAAMDVPALMQRSHRGIYDNAFGKTPSQWPLASPLHQFTAQATPLLLICSSNRKDSCPPNHALNEKARSLNIVASVLEQPLNHGAINDKLGLPSAYTDAVDAFIAMALGNVR